MGKAHWRRVCWPSGASKDGRKGVPGTKIGVCMLGHGWYVDYLFFRLRGTLISSSPFQVRYRDLCSFLKVSPLQTVVKFVDDLQDRALAFEDGLPSFEVLESSSDTTTDALNEPSKKATSATEKGKQRAIEDDPSDRSTSQAEQDDLEGSTRSSKRSQFFSHVELVSKRWDVVSDKDKDVDELETGEETEEEPPVPAKSAGSLSAFSVNEGDPVLKEMVPMTHKQV